MQCQLSLLYREEEREMIPYCAHAGMAVTTFSPLARGYLAGGGGQRAHPLRPLTSTGLAIRSTGDRAAHGARSPSSAACAPAAIAMAWVAGHPGVTAPLVGADAPDQVDAAVAAAGDGPHRRGARVSWRRPIGRAT